MTTVARFKHNSRKKFDAAFRVIHLRDIPGVPRSAITSIVFFLLFLLTRATGLAQREGLLVNNSAPRQLRHTFLSAARVLL